MSRTLINGTGYDVSGGRTLIGGTGYGVSGGKTLIGGTGRTISFINGETYILDSSFRDHTPPLIEQSIEFYSNNIKYNSIKVQTGMEETGQSMRSYYDLYYGSTKVYRYMYNRLTLSIIVDSWTSENYRKIIFTTPPTGDLLTWLNKVATKQ